MIDIDDGLTDEERIRIRDSMSDEDRKRLFEESSNRAMLQLMTGARDTTFEARLTQIEKRLETLELKQ